MTRTLIRQQMSEDLKELLSSVDHTLKMEKDSFLFQEGEESNCIYIINSGRVQISKISPDGKELSLRLCQQGDIVGELTLFSDDPKYLLNARVIESGEVSVIKKDYLENQLLHNSKLAFEFMKWMSDHFRKTQTKFRDLVLHGKKGALYSTLIRLTNSYGVKQNESKILIDIALTNQELANFCGTSRESVNRMLSELKRKAIVTMEKNKLLVHDLQYLRNEINCEDCPIILCSID